MGIVYSIYAIITNVIATNVAGNSLYKIDYITISLAAKQKHNTS